jgi:hypothetical protein
LQPLFKLQILLLAKMQWDVRQAPDEMSSTHLPWPANALARALPLLRSPCVAGDLLRQRAPGLVPHVQYGQHLQQTQEGERWVVVKQILCTVPPHMVAGSLTKVHQDWLCYEDAQDKPVAGEATLAVQSAWGQMQPHMRRIACISCGEDLTPATARKHRQWLSEGDWSSAPACM